MYNFSLDMHDKKKFMDCVKCTIKYQKIEAFAAFCLKINEKSENFLYGPFEPF